MDRKWVRVSDKNCLFEVVSNEFVNVEMEVLEDGLKDTFVDKVVDRNGLFEEEDVAAASMSLT